MGQAALLSPSDIRKLRKHLDSPKHRLIFEIQLFTGERIGAVLRLQITDCYRSASPKQLAPSILFRKETRKGKTADRLCCIAEGLAPYLLEYQLFPGSPLLFPSPRDPAKPMAYRTYHDYFQRAKERAGLEKSGITTHSGRRTYATLVYRSNPNVKELCSNLGWKNTQTALHYVQADPVRVARLQREYDPMAFQPAL